MRTRQSDRGFVLHFFSTCGFVVLWLSAIGFLQSDSGRLSFVDEVTSTTLVGPGGEVEEVPLQANREGGLVPLGTLAPDPGSRYLLVADLGPGGQVVFVTSSSRGSRPIGRCPTDRFRRSCQFVVGIDDGSTEIAVSALNEGRSHRALLSLDAVRISPAHLWLQRASLALLVLTPIVFLFRYRLRLWMGLQEPRPTDDLVFAGLVFALCLFVFHRAPVEQINDSRYLTAVSHSFIHGEGLVIPTDFEQGELKDARRRYNRGYQIDRVGGSLLHHYSPIPAVLDAPIVWIFELVGVTPERPGGFWDSRDEARILRFSAAFASALFCALFYRTARGFLPPTLSLGVALAFAFGTQVLSTLSRPYWAHTWGVLLTAVAIHLVLLPWRRHELLSTGLAGLLSSLAYFCRPQTFWTPLGLAVVLVLLRSWRRFASLVGVGVLCAVLGVLISLSVYGSVLPEYFFASREVEYAVSYERVNSYRYVTGSLGALVSPGRGLLLYSPIFLWVLYQAIRHWRTLSSRVWAGTALGVTIGHLWLIVHTGVWPGGQSYGPRQFSDVLAWLFVLAVLSVEALRRRWPQIPRRTRITQIAVLSLALSFSVFTNFRGAFSRATWTWESYDRPPAWLVEGRQPLMPQHWHWNWRHPQFMAGLLPVDREAAESAEPAEE